MLNPPSSPLMEIPCFFPGASPSPTQRFVHNWGPPLPLGVSPRFQNDNILLLFKLRNIPNHQTIAASPHFVTAPERDPVEESMDTLPAPFVPSSPSSEVRCVQHQSSDNHLHAVVWNRICNNHPNELWSCRPPRRRPRASPGG